MSNIFSLQENNNDLSLKEFKKVFEDLYPQLCLLAYQHLNNLEVSKDIVQDVFLRVWVDNIPFQNKNHISEYFHKTVKDICLDYTKK